jgi:hypothetical protein
MRIISKYIIKELTPHFFLGLLAFTFLLLSGTIIELTSIIITKGIDYSQLLLIISYSLPPLLVLTIPMALLLALWILPGLVSAFTPIGYKQIFAATRDALITAFFIRRSLYSCSRYS